LFNFGKKSSKPTPVEGPTSGARVGSFCVEKYNGKYPTVGLYDCRERRTWVCKPLDGQAIRTSHAALITGVNDATGTVWKDRFVCFWFYTPGTGSGLVLGHPINWDDDAHLMIRIDPRWDYDRQRIIPAELSDQIDDNLTRQHKHGESIVRFFGQSRLKFPFNVHFIGSVASESMFYAKRVST